MGLKVSNVITVRKKPLCSILCFTMLYCFMLKQYYSDLSFSIAFVFLSFMNDHSEIMGLICN